jgi:crotonobetainyl-CoA:carnitine CoA-transferase CaiB-like acyl-CoA transferase
VGYHGGVAAALATLSALLGRLKSGQGQLIDISLQEVILAMVAPLVPGYRYHETTWCRVPDRPPAMGRMKTRDGYVILNAFDDHHFRSFRQLMGNPEWVDGDEWDSLAYRTHHLKDITPMLDAWMETQEKDDMHHKAARKGIPIGPIATAEDVMNNEQYAARGYFVEVDHPAAGRRRYAGWPYKMAATPPSVSRPAPLLGQHNREVCCEVLGYTPDEYEGLSRAGVVESGSQKGGEER